MVLNTKAISTSTSCMEMVPTPGKTEENMMGIGLKARSKVKENIAGQMEEHMWVNIKTIRKMAMENSVGRQMGVIKGIGKRERNMEKVLRLMRKDNREKDIGKMEFQCEIKLIKAKFNFIYQYNLTNL